jgi:hypothetical protein
MELDEPDLLSAALVMCCAQPDCPVFCLKRRSASQIDMLPWRVTAQSRRAVQPREGTIVSRRGACDRAIWRKSLALAADAEGYKFVVWVLNGRFAISSFKSHQNTRFPRTQVFSIARILSSLFLSSWLLQHPVYYTNPRKRKVVELSPRFITNRLVVYFHSRPKSRMQHKPHSRHTTKSL